MSESVSKRARLEDNEIPPILTLTFDLLSFVLGCYGCLYAFKISLVSKTFARAVKQPQFWLHMLTLRLRSLPASMANVIPEFVQYASVLLPYKMHIWPFIKNGKVDACANPGGWSLLMFYLPKQMTLCYVCYPATKDVSYGLDHRQDFDATHHLNCLITRTYVNHKNYRNATYEICSDDSRRVHFIEYYEPTTGKTFYGRGKIVNRVTMVPDEENGAWK